MDRLISKIPGSTPVKAFVTSIVICGVLAIPVFYDDSRQGHSYFSSEKPEAIAAQQDQLRKLAREARDDRKSNDD